MKIVMFENCHDTRDTNAILNYIEKKGVFITNYIPIEYFKANDVI
jgi:hypothetical protein